MLAYTCHQLTIFHENNKFASIVKKWIQQNNSLSCMHTLQPFKLFKFRSHSAKRTDVIVIVIVVCLFVCFCERISFL